MIVRWILDLALLYKLVNRVTNATNELKKIVENHIYEIGRDMIERVSGTAISVSEKCRLFSRVDPCSLFRTLNCILKQ